MSDLAELFSRDPLSLSKPDIAEIVAQLRASRHAFNAGNLRAGSTKPATAKQKETASLAEKLNLNIDL
jgi:hypothetical protein